MGQFYERVSIDEEKRLASGELHCVPSESARGDEKATIGALGRNDPEQLSDALDWDSSIEPVLALDDYPFAAPDELEVDTTVGLASAALPNRITLLAVSLPDEVFKVGPAHLPECS